MGDPFFVISRPTGSTWTVVHRSEVSKEDLNPSWRPFSIAVGKLCASGNKSSDEFKIEVFDWDSDGGHDFIGSFITTLDNLQSVFHQGGSRQIPLISDEYRFEERQQIKFEIYDSDSSSSNLSAHDFLGSLECSVGEIVST